VNVNTELNGFVVYAYHMIDVGKYAYDSAGNHSKHIFKEELRNSNYTGRGRVSSRCEKITFKSYSCVGGATPAGIIVDLIAIPYKFNQVTLISELNRLIAEIVGYLRLVFRKQLLY
jgi:hypothetical protein